MIKEILVPKARIKVIMSVKTRTERETSTKLNLNSNCFTIEGEAVDVMDSENIIKSIARGFSPLKAFELLDENKCLIIIDLPTDKKKLIRIKSRLIGTRGKCRKNLERLTGTYISVYGKTVSIIGDFDSAEICEKAINMLIKGTPHKLVYKSLEEKE